MTTNPVKRKQPPTNFDRPGKRGDLFVYSASLLSITQSNTIHPMPLLVDNGLPSISLRFGTSDDNEINFRCHLDLCAGMNTGNMLLHMWLITEYPHDAVVSFEKSYDRNAFVPLGLDTVIPLLPRKFTLASILQL